MLNGGGGGDMVASDEAVARMLGQLRQSGGATNADVLKELIRTAKRHKPARLDGLTEQVRARYHSRGEHLVAAEIKRRFPDSHESMPVVEVDTVRHAMTQDASVFGHDTPNAWLTFGADDDATEGNEDREPTPEETERMKAFEHVLADAELWAELHEAEKWARGARNCVIQLRWDTVAEALTGKGRVKLTRRWASQVEVIPLWCAPTEERAAIAWVLEATGPDNRSAGRGGMPEGKPERWYELWHREVTIGDDGRVAFGEWHAELIGEESGSIPLFGDGIYPLATAPFLVFRDGLPDASIFLDPGDTLLRTALNIDIEWASHFARLALNGHPFLIIDDPDFEGKTAVTGSGKGMVVKQGTQVTQVRSDVDKTGLDSINAMQRELAVHRNQAPDAYDPAGGGTESGFAKQVKNIDKDRADDKRKLQAKRWLEQRLLPMLVEVADYWGNTGIAHRRRMSGEGAAPGRPLEDVRFHVEFAPAMSYEEPAAKDRRIMDRVEGGYIRPEDGLVEMGVADSSEEARRYLEGFGSKLLRRGGLDAESEGAIAGLEQALRGEAAEVEQATARDDLEAQLGDDEAA
jgi:hypothetical protein